MTEKKKRELIMDTYRKLYKAAGGDFDTLLANATIDEDGRKEIPFMDYELKDEIFEKILEEQIKKYKVPKSLIKRFRQQIYLGASPKSI